jgi:acyl carrier protein
MKLLNDYQKQQVREVLADKLGFDNEDVQDDTHLTNDLGMDSLDGIELLMEFENIFNCNIPDALAENVNIVSDLYDCLSNCL